jgi:hypothetical protein
MGWLQRTSGAKLNPLSILGFLGRKKIYIEIHSISFYFKLYGLHIDKFGGVVNCCSFLWVGSSALVEPN